MARTRQPLRKNWSPVPRSAFKWSAPRARLIHLPDPKKYPRAQSIPIHWTSTNNDISKDYLIILEKHHIILYDIEECKYIEFVEFPKEHNHTYRKMATSLNATNDKLYVFDMGKSHSDLLILDLKTKQWSIKADRIQTTKNVMNFFLTRHGVHFKSVPGSLYSHYIFHNQRGGYYSKFDFKQEKLIQTLNATKNIVSTWQSYCCVPAHIAYIKLLNKLFVFAIEGSKEQSIFTLALDESDATLSDIKLPELFQLDSQCYDIIEGFNSVIFVIKYTEGKLDGPDIWCLDVIDKAWYKSEKNLPSYMKNHRIGFTIFGDRYAHYFDVGSSKTNLHDKIDLFDLAPIELKKKIEDRYRKLMWQIYVFGFIRQEIERIYNLNIPDYLKRIVLCYYTTFDLCDGDS